MQATHLAFPAWDKYILNLSIFLITSCVCSSQSFPAQFTPIPPSDGFFDGASISVNINIGPIYQSSIVQQEGIILIYKPTTFDFVPNQQLSAEQVSTSVSSCINKVYTDASGKKLVFEILPCGDFEASQVSAFVSGIIITIEDLPARVGQHPQLDTSTRIILSSNRRMLVKNQEVPLKKLRILNLSGQLVQEVRLMQDTHLHKMDINHLSLGVYIIEVELPNSVYKTKFWLK